MILPAPQSTVWLADGAAKPALTDDAGKQSQDLRRHRPEAFINNVKIQDNFGFAYALED